MSQENNKGIFVSIELYRIIKSLAEKHKRTLKAQMDVITTFYIKNNEKVSGKK